MAKRSKCQYPRIVTILSSLLLRDMDEKELVDILAKAWDEPLSRMERWLKRDLERSLEYGLVKEGNDGRYTLTVYGLYTLLPVVIEYYKENSDLGIESIAAAMAILRYMGRTLKDLSGLDHILALASVYCDTCKDETLSSSILYVNRATGEYSIRDAHFVRSVAVLLSDGILPCRLPSNKAALLRAVCEYLSAPYCDDTEMIDRILSMAEVGESDKEVMLFVDNYIFDMIGCEEELGGVLERNWDSLSMKGQVYTYIIDRLWTDIFSEEILENIDLVKSYGLVKKSAGKLTRDIVREIAVEDAREQFEEAMEVLVEAKKHGLINNIPSGIDSLTA